MPCTSFGSPGSASAGALTRTGLLATGASASRAELPKSNAPNRHRPIGDSTQVSRFPFPVEKESGVKCDASYCLGPRRCSKDIARLRSLTRHFAPKREPAKPCFADATARVRVRRGKIPHRRRGQPCYLFVTLSATSPSPFVILNGGSRSGGSRAVLCASIQGSPAKKQIDASAPIPSARCFAMLRTIACGARLRCPRSPAISALVLEAQI